MKSALRCATWKPGERVFGIIGGGAQAEYVLAPENQLSEIPANLDWAAAAAIPEAFITAHDALFTQAKLQMGETVLVHAAGSGVGTAAIQLARAAGAKVYGTSRTAYKLEGAKQYGLNGGVVVVITQAHLLTLCANGRTARELTSYWIWLAQPISKQISARSRKEVG